MALASRRAFIRCDIDSVASSGSLTPALRCGAAPASQSVSRLPPPLGCYATHLMEEGVSLRWVSQYLGHATLEQTLVYTHLTAVSEAHTQEAVARLAQGIGAASGPSQSLAPVDRRRQ